MILGIVLFGIYHDHRLRDFSELGKSAEKVDARPQQHLFGERVHKKWIVRFESLTFGELVPEGCLWQKNLQLNRAAILKAWTEVS
jgi:hypothetical protein